MTDHSDFFGGVGGAGRFISELGAHLQAAQASVYLLSVLRGVWLTEEGYNSPQDAVYHGESYWNRKRDALRKSWPELAEALDAISKEPK